MHFMLSNGTQRKFELQPFYQIHDARYMIYWPYVTATTALKQQMTLREKEAALKALELQTIDWISPGEQQPESDHHFLGEQTEAGIHMDRHWRHSTAWFSYELKNTSRAAKQLQLTFFGGDRDRSFDVYVDQTLVKTIRLTGERGAVFYEENISLPATLPALFTVKFVAHTGSVAGGLYGLRLLR